VTSGTSSSVVGAVTTAGEPTPGVQTIDTAQPSGWTGVDMSTTIGASLITPAPGRQAVNAIPVFRHEGRTWHCAASGFRIRKHSDTGETGGVHLHVGTINPLFADVPANDPLHTGCLIAIRRALRN
jgi:hypothetical protein